MFIFSCSLLQSSIESTVTPEKLEKKDAEPVMEETMKSPPAPTERKSASPAELKQKMALQQKKELAATCMYITMIKSSVLRISHYQCQEQQNICKIFIF